mgnify:CR=1 FL=1
MVNYETDKRMEAVWEAASIATRAKDNEEWIKRIEGELQKLQDECD